MVRPSFAIGIVQDHATPDVSANVARAEAHIREAARRGAQIVCLKELFNAPYRIVEPGAEGFGRGGPHAGYYDAFVDEMWANNGITIPKPGPNGSGLAAHTARACPGAIPRLLPASCG